MARNGKKIKRANGLDKYKGSASRGRRLFKLWEYYGRSPFFLTDEEKRIPIDEPRKELVIGKLYVLNMCDPNPIVVVTRKGKKFNTYDCVVLDSSKKIELEGIKSFKFEEMGS